MIILKILLWIIVIIAVIVLLCLFAPLDLELTVTPKKNDFAIRLYRINLVRQRKPKKQKKQQPKEKPKAAKKHSAKQKIKDGREKLQDFLDWAKLILNRIGWLLSNIRVKNLNVKYISGGEDAAKAAIEYGTACALIYPVASLIESKMHIAPNGMKLDISCDYERKEPDYLLEIFLRLRGYHAISAILFIVYHKYLKKDL